jgi:hypothetical protein
MSDKAVVVFTAKSVDRILREGGTSSWRLDRNNALHCAYAICTRNAHADWVEGTEAHHSAFLIGKVSDVVPTHDGRFLIQLSEYAKVNIPNVWKGDRNPVKYASLKDFSIDPAKLKWIKMPEPAEDSHVVETPKRKAGIGPLTMAEAKKALALAFGVSPDAIEITIRG